MNESFLNEASLAHPVMVAFAIPSNIGAQLLTIAADALPADARVTELGELHLTLALLGEADEIVLPRYAVESCVNYFAECHAPLSGKISGIGIFNEVGDGEACLYALFDSPALAAFRQELVEWLTESGIVVGNNHGFVPHITLAYLPKPSTPTYFEIPNLDIEFDGIVVVWDSQWTFLPLLSHVKMVSPVDMQAGSPQVLGIANKIAY